MLREKTLTVHVYVEGWEAHLARWCTRILTCAMVGGGLIGLMNFTMALLGGAGRLIVAFKFLIHCILHGGWIRWLKCQVARARSKVVLGGYDRSCGIFRGLYGWAWRVLGGIVLYNGRLIYTGSIRHGA